MHAGSATYIALAAFPTFLERKQQAKKPVLMPQVVIFFMLPLRPQLQSQYQLQMAGYVPGMPKCTCSRLAASCSMSCTACANALAVLISMGNMFHQTR